MLGQKRTESRRRAGVGLLGGRRAHRWARVGRTVERLG